MILTLTEAVFMMLAMMLAGYLLGVRHAKAAGQRRMEAVEEALKNVNAAYLRLVVLIHARGGEVQ